MIQAVKTINILGAFDRYNYGDLLFPIIMEEYLKEYDNEILNKYQLEFYGLIDSDLSAVGGKKTKNIRSLYEKNISDGSAVIVSGGEVLGAKNFNLYLHLCKNYPEYVIKNFITKGLRKIVGEKLANNLFRQYFGIQSDYPWIIEQSHFENEVLIMYNTVGGRLPKKNSQYYYEQLTKASYISVRENDVYTKLNISNAKIYPDSATAMSKFFPIKTLERLITSKIHGFVNENPKYICIQTNMSIYKKNKKEFHEQINKIHRFSKEVKIVLLPLGYATDHDDRIALRMMSRELPNIVHLVENLNLYEMMYLIGNCSFFAGTSLHGNITAMSYAVPHVGLSKDRPKLESYLATWDIKGQDHCIEISSLFEYYIKSLDINKGELENKMNELIDLVIENFSALFSKL